MKYIYAIFTVFLLSISANTLYAQCDTCTETITFYVDLSQNPDSVWTSPHTNRSGKCCIDPNLSLNCIRFEVTTHPDAQQLSFYLAEPPIPPAMEYSPNCDEWQSVDIPMCINGTGPHCIVYCKPGNDKLKYMITSAKVAEVSPPIIVGEGCIDTIWARGFDIPSIRWNVVNPGPEYNSYLSATSGVEEVIINGPPVSTGVDYFDVEVTGELSGGCAGSTMTDTVRVYFVSTKDVQILPKDPTICYGGSSIELTAEPEGGEPPYNYLWSTGETTKSIWVSSAGDYSVQVTDVTDCPPVETITTVRVFESPISVEVGDLNICTSSPTVQLNGVVHEASGGIWSGGTGAFTPSETDLQAEYTLSSSELLNGFATLTLTSTGNGGCPPDSEDLTITVSPEPFVDAGDDGIVCASTMEIPLEGEVSGDAYQGEWSTLGEGAFIDPSNLHTSYIPTAGDIAVGYVDLILSSIANGICEPVRDTVRIFFGNEPVPNFTFPQPACSGQDVQFTDLSTVGWGVISQWYWDFGNGVTSPLKNPKNIYQNPGTYTVSLEVTSDKGCTTSITQDIVISEDPVADFSFSQTCFGEDMSFTDLSSSSNSWYWVFNNGTASNEQNPSGVSYSHAGTFDVSLTVTSPEGCENTVTKPVEVLPMPVAQFSVDPICVDNPIEFEDESFVQNDVIVDWSWNMGNGFVSSEQNPTTTYSTTNPVDVSLTVSTATCSNTLTKTVTPHPLPVVTPVYEQGCTPLSVTPNIPVESNVLYQWDFGDGTSSTVKNPTHMYTNSTSAIAEYTLALRARSSYGCRDSVFSEIRVYPESRADYSVSDRKICSGEEIMFTNQSQNAVQYQWDFGDGTQSVAQNPSHVFENTTGTAVFYPVTLTVWSSQSCIDSVTQFITVYPDPVFPVTLNTDAACHPATINFETESGGQTYYWDFGDGTSTNGSNIMRHTFQNPGLTDEQFEVHVIVTDNFGCIAETTEIITVFASPIADFSVPYSQMCAPELLLIENNSYNVSEYQWDFGDGNTSTEASAIVEHTYENLTENTQTYNLQLAVVSPSGCLDTLKQEIDVYPNIHADFTPDPVSGCSPLLVSFTNQSVGAHAHYWNFGDNMYSTQAHPNHVYSHSNFTPTDFEIEYVAVSTYGCSDTVRKNVTVKPLTQADFTPSHTTVCSEEEISFQNNSINALDYFWDFGDGSTSVAENPTHTYVNTQEDAALYTVRLIVTSVEGCTDTLERLITVYPIPEISVTLDKSASCSPAEISLTTESGAQSYFWDFGDGETTYANSSIRHTYINQDVVDKEYTVSVLVRTKEGCETFAEEQLMVYASPIADFSTVSSTLCAPMELSITNNTFNAETYYWSFGDGDVSYSANPTLSHIYENTSDDEKQFDLQLTAESSNGCVDVAYKSIVVYPTLDVSVETTELTGCSPLRVDFTNNSIGVDKHIWSFGDGKTSYEEAPAHVYFNDLFVPQEYIGKYSASSVFGCVDSTEFIITVSPQTQAGFTASDTEICNGETVEFTNTSINALEYTWLLPDGEIAHDEHLNYTFINETSTTVYEPIQLIVESEYGCVDSIVHIITIYPQPHGEIIPDTNQGCDPLQVTFSAPAGGMKYMWDLGDGVLINGSHNLTHTFVNQSIDDKIYPVELTITSINGCVQTMNQEITVFTSPKASFSMDTNIGCSPVTIHFENTTEDAISYTWDFGDGDVREISDMQFEKTYSNTSAMEASHSIMLTAVSENGCEHVADNSLSVFPEIQALFTPDYNGNCTPLEVSFDNQTLGAYSYKWHFGDGNYSSNFTTKHVYLNNTQETINNTVFLVAKSPYNCIDTSEHIQIPVHPKPFANFDADIITACSPFETRVENLTEGATEYLWFIDEGLYAQGEQPEPFVFSNMSDTITNHMLKLSAINEFNCVDTSLQPIAVFPEVEARFNCDERGCSPFTVSFENLSENSSSYMWDFGNQKMSSVKNPTTTFINESTEIKEFIVTLTTTSSVGCHSSTTQNITVYPSPRPNFITSASYLRIPESTIGVENLTEGEWRYLWSFGDGAKSDDEQPSAHTYNSPGEYKVILKAYSPYCEDTTSHFIVIGGAQVYADYDSSFVGCVPLTVSFTNKSKNAEWYSWDFGDGGSRSDEENPTYTYTEPGTYIVELTAGNDEVQDVSRAHTVSVFENPVADFEVAPEIAYLPNAVITTYNKSVNGYDYTWYFGDGESSEEFQASHEYFEEGWYDVALAVTTREGCYDSLMIEDAVQVLLKCELIFPNVFTPINIESDGYYNPDEPELTNDIFHPVWRNIIDYELQIFNRWGELVFESHELERGWNGFYKGELSKSDVYVWRVQASCWGGKKINLKGNVTLLR